MFKTILSSLALVLVIAATKPAAASDAAVDRQSAAGTGVASVSLDGTRPTVGMQWAGTGERHGASFTPAPPFLLLMAVAGPTGVAALLLHLTRPA